MTKSRTVSRAPLRLPVKLNSAGATDLRAEIAARAGADLTLDAGDVAQVGALCLQVLLSARAAWRQAGHAFEITNLSSQVCASMAVLGVAPSEIGQSEV